MRFFLQIKNVANVLTDKVPIVPFGLVEQTNNFFLWIHMEQLILMNLNLLHRLKQRIYN